MKANKVVRASQAFGENISSMFRRDCLHNLQLPTLEALCTKPVRWCGAASLWLQHESERSCCNALQLIFVLLSFPCFKLSHLFFKLAYAVNHRKLRRLCSEDLFLNFYNGRVADGGVVDILQSLREIESGLNGADPCLDFRDHIVAPPL